MELKPVAYNRGEAVSKNVLGTDMSFLISPEDTGGAFEMFEILLPDGVGIPPHAHPWAETYYITEGCLSIDVEGKHHDLRPGGILNLPADVVHGFVGVGDTRLLLMCEGSAFGEICAEIPVEPPSPETMAVVARVMAEKGMRLVMPESPEPSVS